MDLQETIRTRRSIRKFKPDPILEGDIRRIVELAALAPSASNKQMWKFLAVTNRRVLGEIKDAIINKWNTVMEWPESAEYRDRLEGAKGYSTFFTEAPVTFFVFQEPYLSAIDEILEKHGLDQLTIDAWRKLPAVQSIGAATENLCLAAHSMGYGTCWMSSPCIAGKEIGDLLDLEPPWELVAVVPMGVPDEAPAPRPRKPVEEVLEFVR